MKAKEIKQRLDEGWIQAIITFEVVGKPAEHIERALRGYIGNVKASKGFEVIDEEFGDPEEGEGGLFSVFYEGEMLVKSLEDLVWLCVNYSPASVEILEPAEMVVPARELTNWFNDLLSRLHEIGIKFKESSGLSQTMVKNMNKLIYNAILAAVDAGDTSVKKISAKLGIGEEQLQPFLDEHVKKGALKKKGAMYSR